MRRERRDPVNRSARIDLGGNQTLTCRILNLSRGGALLLVPNSEWLPKTCSLIDVFTGTTRQIAVVWRGANCAGVRFLDAPATMKPKQFGRRT